MPATWIGDLFSHGDWRVPLEIALIAIGLYFLYRNFRATGAWKALSALLAGLGLYAVARLLDLRGIEWILSHFTSIALIAAVVLFQPELRRLFERTSFRRTGKTPLRPHLASLVADVLFDLTRRKWGALLVVPGKESIASWVSRGIPLDATPSHPLLLSIFDPDSPGHDGAVVLDGERLSAFGVRLPLSESGKLPNVLGTRHHAALGLAEVSDALVLVVSEERQEVSAFSDGRQLALPDPSAVARTLEAHWSRALGQPGAEGADSRLRRVAWGPLLTCVAIAALFWFSILPKRGAEATEMSVTVPVEYVAMPARLGIVSPLIERARVEIAGRPAALWNLDPAVLRVRIDLSDVVPGEQELPLSPQNVDLPLGLRLVDVDPASLTIEAVPLVEREIVIEPQFVGEPPPGQHVARTVVQPASLRVLMPEQGSEGPPAILTAPIHIEDTRGPTQVTAQVILPTGMKPVGRWPEGVTVSFTVEPD